MNWAWATTTTTLHTHMPSKVAEYMGIACPICYKPIDLPSGGTDPRVCQHDNTEWLSGERRTTSEVFEIDYETVPYSGQEISAE